MLVEQKRGRLRSPYLEGQAKSYINDEIADVERVLKGGGRGENYCGKYAKVGRCENGHQYIKLIYCNKEWCENCRQMAHGRRIARWLPKILTMPSFGYFVFTIPMEMRGFYKDKKQLSRLRSYLRRRLKQIYPDIKALVRWHWFSEKSPCLYHPHLNLLVSCFEKLPKEELERIKQDYKKALERFTGQKIASETNPEGKVDVHYQFVSASSIKEEFLKIQRREKKQSKILRKKHIKAIRKRLASGESLDEICQDIYRAIRFHRLKYITRATFTVYNKGLAEKLKNYRNGTIWGRFPELPYEEVEKMAKQREAHSKVSQDLILLESGHCPKCGARLNWDKQLYPASLASYGKEIGNGYFELPIKIRGSPKMNWKAFREELSWKKLFLSEQAQNIQSWLKNEQKRRDIWD